MKKLLLIVIAVITAGSLLAQAPSSFKYQTVVRNADGAVIAAQGVSFQISILSGSSSGNVEYRERHFVSTNDFGLVNLNIGEGDVITGDMATIDWGSDVFFMQIEFDPTGGNSFVLMGTSQLLSVPYAMHAKTAENVFSGNYNDLANTPAIPANTSDLNNDSGFITSADDADADPNNEIQVISISNDTIYLSNGGIAKLPAGFSGSFNDLSDVPALLDVNYEDDFNGDYNSLSNAPTNVSSFTNDAGYLTSSQVQFGVHASSISYNLWAISSSLDFHGRLSNSDGSPAAGIMTVTFSLYDTPVGGFPLWQEIESIMFNGGYFDYHMGYINPGLEDLFNQNSELYFEISVGPEVLVPRIAPERTGIAMKSYYAGSVDWTNITSMPANLDIDATDDFDGAYSSLSGAPANVSTFTNDAGYLTTEVDGDASNELQFLSYSNDTIYLSDGGFVKLPASFTGSFNDLTDVPANLDTDATDDFDGAYSSLSGAPTNVSTFTNDAGYLTSEVDGSVTNELQDLSSVLGLGNDGAGNQIKNIGSPTDGNDAVTKLYVDQLIARIDYLEEAVFTEHPTWAPVQFRLDQGETPKQIYDSDNTLLDSIYGKIYQGGYIFYFNSATGTGIVAALSDQSNDMVWAPYGTTNAVATAIGSGQSNTNTIVAYHGAGNYAASVCNDYTDGVYSDWYLPSKNELDAMYDVLHVNGIGNFMNDNYWSSTEFTISGAWEQKFTTGAQGYDGNKAAYHSVRAIRSF